MPHEFTSGYFRSNFVLHYVFFQGTLSLKKHDLEVKNVYISKKKRKKKGANDTVLRKSFRPLLASIFCIFATLERLRSSN